MKNWLIAAITLVAVGGFIIYRAHSTSGTPYADPTTLTNPPAQTTPAPAKPSCISADQAASQEGQTGCVQFVGHEYTSNRGEMYLDQSTSAPYGFSAWIPAGSSFGSSLVSQYSGKEVDVTGAITSYNGEPEIEVISTSQVQSAQ